MILRENLLRRLYDPAKTGPYWKQKRGPRLIVRGTGRRVIIVRSPDPQVFEEAIFVLKEDYVRSRGAEQVVEEARQAAEEYLRRHGAPERRASFPWGAVIAGGVAALAAAAYFGLRLIGG